MKLTMTERYEFPDNYTAFDRFLFNVWFACHIPWILLIFCYGLITRMSTEDWDEIYNEVFKE